MNAPHRPPPAERPPRPQRRKVGLFVAAHVAAVAGLYGVALAVGGGWASPPFPPDVQVSRGSHDARPRTPVDGAAPAAAHAQARTAAHGAERGSHAHQATRALPAGLAVTAATASALPAWAQSAEARAPWEAP